MLTGTGPDGLEQFGNVPAIAYSDEPCGFIFMFLLIERETVPVKKKNILPPSQNINIC